ncbi:MAG: hypothetical protein ABI744_02510 [Chloroflexota bacterium]
MAGLVHRGDYPPRASSAVRQELRNEGCQQVGLVGRDRVRDVQHAMIERM